MIKRLIEYLIIERRIEYIQYESSSKSNSTLNYTNYSILKTTSIKISTKKICHMIKSSSIFIIIYIDHDVALKIVKKITFIILLTNKLNLRLIKAFDYVQRFNLKIRYEFEIQYVIFDAFSRFASFNIEIQLQNHKNKFNVFFIVILIEINNNFRFRILKNYQKNFL